MQLPKARYPIEVTELGIITEVRPEQPINAPSPIEVTDLGIVTDVRPVQLENVQFLIEVTELGIVTAVSPVQLPMQMIHQIISQANAIKKVHSR